MANEIKPLIKVMAEYQCWPLWLSEGPELCNIDPESLPLSEELVEELSTWASFYETSFVTDDPAGLGWRDIEEQQAFVECGLELAKRVASEIGTDAAVVYFNAATGQEEVLSGQ